MNKVLRVIDALDGVAPTASAFLMIQTSPFCLSLCSCRRDLVVFRCSSAFGGTL
jgi:hypothetical protein